MKSSLEFPELIDGLHVDNGHYHPFSRTDCSRNLPWIFRISRPTILHVAHFSHRDWFDNLLYCVLWMLWRDEGKLLHDFDSKNFCLNSDLSLNFP